LGKIKLSVGPKHIALRNNVIASWSKMKFLVNENVFKEQIKYSKKQLAQGV
jgi:hypothetical protein